MWDFVLCCHFSKVLHLSVLEMKWSLTRIHICIASSVFLLVASVIITEHTEENCDWSYASVLFRQHLLKTLHRTNCSVSGPGSNEFRILEGTTTKQPPVRRAVPFSEWISLLRSVLHVPTVVQPFKCGSDCLPKPAGEQICFTSPMQLFLSRI